MSNKWYTFPEGTITHMAVATPYTNSYKGNRKEYYCRVMFDGSTTEGKEVLNYVKSVNPNLIVTKSKTFDIPEGHFTVKAWSGGEYQPRVVDYNRDVIENIPSFPKGSTGTAIITVSTFGTDKGSGLCLREVALGNLNLAESNYTDSGISKTLEARLKEVNK